MALPALLALVWATAATAQPESTEAAADFDLPGLTLVLRSVDGAATDARVARLLALYVPEEQTVSPFLDAGPFEAAFRGAIQLDLNDWYRFSLRGSGTVQLSIGGTAVIERQELPADDAPLSTDGEVRLSKGLNPIELVYRSPTGGDAALRLTWGNDYLPEEPVPPGLLRRADTPALDRGAARRAARDLFAESMCVRCHPVADLPSARPRKRGADARLPAVAAQPPGHEDRQLDRITKRSPRTATSGSSRPDSPDAANGPRDGMPELQATGPDLDGIGDRLRPQWIERWLLEPKALWPQARMPQVLSTNAAEARQQAADLVAWLVAASRHDDLEAHAEGDGLGATARAAGLEEADTDRDHRNPLGSLAGNVTHGRRLYAETGCAACHGEVTSTPSGARTAERSGSVHEPTVGAAPRLVRGRATEDPVREAPAEVRGHGGEPGNPAEGGERPQPGGEGSASAGTRGDAEGDGPAVRLGDKWQPSALAAYLLEPARFDPWSRMPGMALNPVEASSLARYLLTPASEGGAAAAGPVDAGAVPATGEPNPTPPAAVPASIRGNAERGRQLADRLRCRSCHSLPGGDPPPPAAPVAGLAGRASIWIRGESTRRSELDVVRNAVRGSRLAGRSRSDDLATRDHLDTGLDSGRTGTSGPAVARNHPRYDLDAGQVAAIEQFLTEDVASLSRAAPIEFAERRIRSASCLACHGRDGVPAAWSPPPPGISSPSAVEGAAGAVRRITGPPDSDSPSSAEPTADTFQGIEVSTESAPPSSVDDTLRDDFATSADDETGPDLLPPDLTWAGEKLRSDWLGRFVAGRSADRTRPHLRVRMPAFPAAADLLAAGLHHQHGLPASAPDDEPVDAELAAIGRDLIRGDRLGCHSCHAVGEEPALGGEGSAETINLDLARKRLRRPYFDRFLRDPQRILPGSKMPSFVDDDGYTALYDVFDGEASRQFEAIWHYLGSLD